MAELPNLHLANKVPATEIQTGEYPASQTKVCPSQHFGFPVAQLGEHVPPELLEEELEDELEDEDEELLEEEELLEDEVLELVLLNPLNLQ